MDHEKVGIVGSHTIIFEYFVLIYFMYAHFEMFNPIQNNINVL